MNLADWRPFAIFLAAYATALALLLDRLSLWLDEILLLIGARLPNLGALLEYFRILPGNTPLSFLVPHWTIEAFGDSVFTARLTPAIFSVLSCAAVWLLARRVVPDRALIAVLLFALCPLQFRYALEARPYSQVLCFGLWATVVFFAMRDRPRWWLAIAYIALTMAAGFTLAYGLFVPATHAAWIAWKRDRRAAFVAVGGVAITGIALFFWYLGYREDWKQIMAAEALPTWNPRAVFVFLRELTGAGYVGTALLGAGAALGARRVAPGPRRFWLFAMAAPVAMVVAGNFVFGYFFAIRQVLFIVVPLAILFAAQRHVWLTAALLVAFLYGDVRWFQRPREDWAAAARSARAASQRVLSQQGSCILFWPEGTESTYAFFDRGLIDHTCPPRDAFGGDRIVLAISPYHPRPVPAGLAGWSRVSSKGFDGPRVEVWERAR